MSCQVCGSERVLSVYAKCADGFDLTFNDEAYTSTEVENISGGECVELEVCLDCGRVQGNFPVAFNGEKEEQQELKKCDSVQQWIDAMKNHKCDKKELACCDLPMKRLVGTVCVGCGEEFYIELGVIRTSMECIDEETKKLLITAKGRQDLVKSCQ